MSVDVFALSREYEARREAFSAIFDRVAAKGDFILGREVEEFEAAFAAYTGMAYAVGVGSGTDALRVGGLACGLLPGDRVVTTPNTYVATVMALSIHGIVPVLCDIDPETYTMDPASLEAVLAREKSVRLCIPVHLYGHPCFMDEIRAVCEDRDVRIMEDACQAHGARYKGRRVGSFGDVGAFSFYPTKNLGCYGDGGAVVTSDRALCEDLRSRRNYGQREKHRHVFEGFNSRLDELQAALLAFKLKSLDDDNERRRSLAALYRSGLEGLPIALPVEKPFAYHVYHLFVIGTDQRDRLAEYLREKGVGTLVHYPVPIHLQEAYRGLGYREGSFPRAEKAAREVLSLPMYPFLKEEEVAYVCETIRAYFRR